MDTNPSPDNDRGFRWLWLSIVLIVAFNVTLCPRIADAQAPADSLRLDSLRTEVVRLRGFVRAAETQATKALAPTVRDSILAEVVRMRGFLRAAETQATKSLDLVDALRGVPVGPVPPPDTTTPATPPPLPEVVGVTIEPATSLALTVGDSARLRVVSAIVLDSSLAVWRRDATDAELARLGAAGRIQWTARGVTVRPVGDGREAVVVGTEVGVGSVQGCVATACAFRGVTVAGVVVPVPPDTTPPPPVVVPPDTTAPPTPPARLPELPRVTPTPGPLPAAVRTLVVVPGTDTTMAPVQAAVDSARGGDHVVLPAGRTFVGTLRLPARPTSDTGWVVVRSAALDSLPEGERVTPADSLRMPRLVAFRTTEQVIATAPGAHHWRLAGVHVSSLGPFPSKRQGYTLVALGDASSAQSDSLTQPHHLVLERLLIQPDDSLNFQRCIALNSGWTAIVQSWIAECHGLGFDSQAIGGWNGSGPYLIHDNYLAGAGENVMFGGADPRDSTLMARDITITRNHIHKPAAWKGVWSVKNLLELKLGRRVLVEGNVLDGVWTNAQTGFAVVMKSTNQSGGAPWSQTSDVTFRLNHITNAEAGVSIAGAPESRPVVPANTFLIEQNALDLGQGPHVGTGRMFQFGQVADLAIRRNTGVTNQHAFVIAAGENPRLTITENLLRAGPYGLTTVATFAEAAPGATFSGNVLATAQSARVLPQPPAYPGNVYPGAIPLPITLDALAARFPLAGADLAAVAAATAGVVIPPQ